MSDQSTSSDLTNFQQLVELVNEMQADAAKFYDRNNSTAGTRTRKRLLQVKALAHEARKEIQDRINSVKEERKAKRAASAAEPEAEVEEPEPEPEPVAAKPKKAKKPRKPKKAAA